MRCIVLVFLMGSTLIHSQIKVYLKNGEVKEGNIGKFTTAYVTAVKSFKLKTDEKGKFRKYKAKETDSILLYQNGRIVVYHSLLGVYGKPDFYALYERGKVNIYEVNSMAVTGYGAFTSTFYPIKRRNEERIANLDKGGPYWSNFAKIASEYFLDCPELAEKIKNREKGFTNKDKLKIAQYYNKSCN